MKSFFKNQCWKLVFKTVVYERCVRILQNVPLRVKMFNHSEQVVARKQGKSFR